VGVHAEPLMPKIGLGMKVACSPLAMATFFTTNRNVLMLSAVASTIVVAKVDLVLTGGHLVMAASISNPCPRAPGRSGVGPPRPCRRA